MYYICFENLNTTATSSWAYPVAIAQSKVHFVQRTANITIAKRSKIQRRIPMRAAIFNHKHLAILLN